MANAAARSVARIKQLSCLGLGGEAFMPALFHELAELVPSHGCFQFSDAQGQLANVYQEAHPVEFVELHIREFVNRREREVSIDFTEQVLTRVGVLGLEQLLTVDRSTFEKSDLYNLVLREIGSHDIIRLVVRDHGRPFGILSLHRPAGTVPFGAEDRRCLASLGVFIAHAIVEGPKIDWRLVDSGRSSLVIANTEGRLIHSTEEGQKLLNLASYPWVTKNAPPRFRVSLPPAIVQICRNLAGIFRRDSASPAPVHHHRNELGRFTFRAYWLESNDPGGLIGITISHEEPLPIAIMRRVNDFHLSRRQAQVCFLLANDWGHERIARELGISKHTVIAHSRWIYNKLDIHSRGELTTRLLAC